MKKVEACYVVDSRGKKGVFAGEIITIKDIGHKWGIAEVGEYDDGHRPLLSVAKVDFDLDRFDISDVIFKKLRISKDKKKVVFSKKIYHIKEDNDILIAKENKVKKNNKK